MALLASSDVGIRGPALLTNRVAKLYAVGVRRPALLTNRVAKLYAVEVRGRALLADFSVLVAP